MKKTVLSILSLLLALVCVLGCFGLVACDGKQDPNETTTSGTGEQQPSETDALWANAIYKDDKALGNGAKTVQVEVKAGDKSITFTLKTDKSTLADAMLEHGLVAGDNAAYGLYIKTVNGILADWDVDQTYWALSKDGTATATGASGVTVADGEHYEFTRTK